MSYRRTKKLPYNPFVLHDGSFDAEEAMQHAPKIIERVLVNNFSQYSPQELRSIIHHVARLSAHRVTDGLCQMYPEESYNKLSRWADWFSFTYVTQKFKQSYNKVSPRPSI